MIEHTTCIDPPLIGTYDKNTNLNFALAVFASTNRVSDYYAMIRSQTYNGVLIFDIRSDNGEFSNSMMIQDPTHNDSMDGQLLHHSINRFEGIFINSFVFLFKIILVFAIFDYSNIYYSGIWSDTYYKFNIILYCWKLLHVLEI